MVTRLTAETTMLRSLLGVAVGGAVGLGAIYGWQLLGHQIFPQLSGIDPTDPLKRMVLVNSMSFAARSWVVAGYAVGVVVGGFLANLIADARWPSVALAMTTAGVFFGTLTFAPHPFWMQLTGILLPLLAGLGIAARVGRRTLDG